MSHTDGKQYKFCRRCGSHIYTIPAMIHWIRTELQAQGIKLEAN